MASEPIPSRAPGEPDDHTRSFDFFAAPHAAQGSGGPVETEIGPYKLELQLGEGGMGAVYRAVQQEPIRREVALKIIKPGMDSRQVIARFESERQALAVMDHPHIARVFDAGTTAAGLPYFAMELVAGMPITRYCDTRRLTVRERIALFLPVCKAIQHAHQKGVIHRDLKPSNILVAEQDGKPAPKVIDFGLAKALAQEVNDATMLTNVGTVLGTLDYMSPEQADPLRQDVDTRGDVYSLGAVLYELLTGTTPLDRDRLGPGGYVEALRRIRDDETPPPSTRLRQSATGAQIAGLRQSDPSRLTKLLTGELDWILTKALQKDRAQRYESVNGLERDLERYLAGEPVDAAPPSAAYRMQKFIRKHVVAFSFAGTILTLLMVFAVAVAVQAGRIARERDRANRITQFMVGIFRVSDPGNTRGNSVTAREILDKSAQEIDTGLTREPQVQADLLRAMAESYDGLGLYDRARDLARRTLDIDRRVLGPRDRATLETMSFIGSTMVSGGDSAGAVPWLKDTLALQEKALAADDRDTLITRGNLSDALFGESDFQGAERMASETLAKERRLFGSDSREALKTMSRLAESMELQGHYADAEKLDREVLAADQRSRGAEDPETLFAIDALAKVLVEEGSYGDAEAMLSRVVPIEQRIFGPDHPHTTQAVGNLGYVYLKEGRYAEAEQLYRQLVDSITRFSGTDELAVSEMQELAITYAHEGRWAEAARVFHRAIEISAGHHDPLEKVAWYNFACAAAIAGRREEALRYLREAVAKGFTYPDQIAGDNDLASLRADPAFAVILQEARTAVAKQEKQ